MLKINGPPHGPSEYLKHEHGLLLNFNVEILYENCTNILIVSLYRKTATRSTCQKMIPNFNMSINNFFIVKGPNAQCFIRCIKRLLHVRNKLYYSIGIDIL